METDKAYYKTQSQLLLKEAGGGSQYSWGNLEKNNRSQGSLGSGRQNEDYQLQQLGVRKPGTQQIKKRKRRTRNALSSTRKRRSDQAPQHQQQNPAEVGEENLEDPLDVEIDPATAFPDKPQTAGNQPT